ncbi:hypothetical protein PXH59_00110 (plasmid) [Xenorhabdus sp. SF857]|uniref:hypothetical protein n=1 Tax=Xenorhabdus bakwenae TaxID=3026967 RepID=UPI0025583AF2|nr:hypothetical protein [Xenorhabdus sp. SF857]WFQ78070.1 hypothetical protein PXH59_00025 [Xenorhabdus sp. SF857]WFQ78086.1 hypothetical protein PXH59_00110 [Xenorhabdus sp. SF857]
MASINWEYHQRELGKSGLSLSNYCKNNKLNYSTARNKLRAGGGVRPEKVQQKAPETKQKSCNFNALKHGGYARLFARRLVNESEMMQSGLNQEIAVARMQTALVINLLDEKPNLETVLSASEALQRLLGRIESLLVTQTKLDNDLHNHADFLTALFVKRRVGEISATEAAYRFMEKGFDVPPALLAEMRLELGDDDEERGLLTGTITPQMVEDREKQLQSGNVISSEAFIQQRLEELEELNRV